jgi:hypothetical protein
MGTKSWKNYFSHGIFDIAKLLTCRQVTKNEDNKKKI